MAKIFGRNQGDLIYNESTGYSSTDAGAGIRSPWTGNDHLAAAIIPQMPDGPIGRIDALAVPPVARAVALYATVAASLPLVTEGGTAPAWLTKTSGAVTAAHRTGDVVQDLIFTAGSVLYREDDGGITRLPRAAWKLDDEGYVVNQDGERHAPEKIIYIRGLMEQGFLDYGQSAVNHYKSLLRTILSRGENPVPLLDLHITDQTEATEEELEYALDQWSKARRAKNGATAFTPSWIEAKPVGNAAGETMLTEARNAVRLDVANFLNINAAMLDGNNGTSDTYSNTLQNQAEFIKLSLRQFLLPIEARLSQDDVTAPGVTVKFDLSEFEEKVEAAGRAVSEDAK